MKTFAKVTGEDLAFFESILPGRVFSGGNVSSDYEHDEMTIYGLYAPEAVLLAQNTDEISAVLRYCCQKGIAVTPRGAGTGLCGGCVAVRGGIVLSTERMKRVLEVDEKNMTATVEPGVLLMEFPKALEGTGLSLSARSRRKDGHHGRKRHDQCGRHACRALWRNAGLRAGDGSGFIQRGNPHFGRKECENFQRIQPD